MTFRPSTVQLAPDAPLAVRTAADEIAAATGARLVAPGETNQPSVALLVGDDLRRFPSAFAKLNNDTSGKWELVTLSGQTLVIAGSTPRNVCSAALGWLESPERETNRLARHRFT